jgi:hypothetical protein
MPRPLELDRLAQHREAVLVHILVVRVLVDLEAQRRQLGQHELREAGVDEPRSRMACSVGVSTVKPSCDVKRAARSILRGSSPNETSGGDGVRRMPAMRSSRPPFGSTSWRSGRRSAIALTVKSLRWRSPSRVSPNSTVGLRVTPS